MRALAASIVSLMLAGCTAAAGPSGAGGGSGQSPAASIPASVDSSPAASPNPSSASALCRFWDSAATDIRAAASAAMTGGNEAGPLRSGISKIVALAAVAQDPSEKQDLTTLAETLDRVALSGGGFTEWDPAYEAFYVKYAPRCGQPVAS